MQSYKIYMLDAKGHTVLSYAFEGPDDLSALDESRKHSRRNAIEIWQRARLVARIARGGEAVIG